MKLLSLDVKGVGEFVLAAGTNRGLERASLAEKMDISSDEIELDDDTDLLTSECLEDVLLGVLSSCHMTSICGD